MNRMKWMVLACALLAIAVMGAEPATRPATQSLAGESHQVESVGREGMLLRPRDASSKEGERIVVYPHEDWRCMTWRFEPTGEEGTVRLMNYFTHKTFGPDGKEDGARVVQHKAGKQVMEGERWRFVPVGDGVYRIESAGSGKVLTANEEGDVVLGKWVDGAGQKWKLRERPGKFTG